MNKATPINVSSVIGGFLCLDVEAAVNLNTTLDLSLCAHDTVTVLFPSGYALLICLPYLIHLLRRSTTDKPRVRNARHTFLTTVPGLKLLLTVLVVLFNMAELAFVLYSALFVSQGFMYHSIFHSLVMLATSISVLLLTFIEQKQNIATSICLFAFWLLALLTVAFRFVSGITQSWHLATPFSVFFAFTCLRLTASLVLTIIYAFVPGQTRPKRPKPNKANDDLLLSEMHRKESSIDDKNPPSPDSGSSVASRLTFWWMSSLIWNGWRRPLKSTEIFQLPEGQNSEVAFQQFDAYWQRCLKEVGAAPSKPTLTLLKALFMAFGGGFLSTGILKIFAESFLLCSPIYMMIITSYMKDHESRPVWHGYLAALALLISTCLQFLFQQNYFIRVVGVGMRARGALIAAIFQKSLRLSNAAKQQTNTGQTVNLIVADAGLALDSAMHFHLLWSGPFQIAATMALIWINLGAATLAGLGVMLATVAFSSIVVRFSKRFSYAKMKKKDERVKLINEMLTGMKAVKLYAWEESFQAQIEKTRSEEVALLRKSILLHCISYTVWNIVPRIVTLVTFAAYIYSSPDANLDPVKAFTAVVLFNLMRLPLQNMPTVISTFVQVSIALKRIAHYLTLEELDETAVIRNFYSFGELGVVVRDGTFSWLASSSRMENVENGGKETAGAFSLKSVNLTISRGQLVAIVGKVGCGKSSILSAILGEMEKLSGTVELSGSCGYVAQTPWIQNSTLKNNVLFMLPEEPNRYQAVIDACALRPDLEMLAAGDATEIGEKGINLSGGQKQRVALARALYNNADVYLLDDPLSAVDAYTAHHLFDRVIGPRGLLAKHPGGPKTRIWATHRLNFLPHCDHIIVMDQGRITAQGTFPVLLEKSTLFCDLIRSYMASQDVGDEEALDLETAVISSTSSVQNACLLNINEVNAHRRNSIRSNISECKPEISEINPKTNEKSAKSILTVEEQTQEGQVKLSIISLYIKTLGVVFVVLAILFALLSNGLFVAAQNHLSVWTNEVVANTTIASDTKTWNFAVVSFFYLGQALAFFVATVILALASIRAAVSLHSSLLTSMTHTAMLFFESTPLGRIVNRFSKDIDLVDSTLREAMLMFLNSTIQVAATFIIISIKLPVFLTIGLPLLVAYVVFQRVYVASFRQLSRIESVSRSPMISNFSETVSGASSIRAFGKQNHFIERFQRSLNKNLMAAYVLQLNHRWLTVRIEFIAALVIFATALVGVANRDTLDPGSFGLALSFAMSLSNFLTIMVQQSSHFDTNIVAVERIDEYMTTPKEGAWSIPSVDLSPQMKNWPKEGEIVFDEVVMRYREDLEPALRGLTFTVKPHERVGIVGRTGAGKSSLSLALLRIIEISSGRILIDGFDLRTVGIHVLRRAVTSIPQDPTLFSGSLRLNLDPFSEHSDEVILKALELVELRQFVESDPNGLDLVVAENGDNLSVGQRQLVCMARALLRRPKDGAHRTHILLMDEATAAIDVNTDRIITDMVRREFTDSTVLTIAHRLDTVIDYDRILVLANGRLAEYDSPQNLLANPKSELYKLAKSAGLTR